MSMKVPTIVEEAQQALQAGYCVVIGLQSTGEVCFLFLSNFFCRIHSKRVIVSDNIKISLFQGQPVFKM